MNSIHTVLCTVFFFGQLAQAATAPWKPSLRISGRRIVGIPASNHSLPSHIAMEISVLEGCEAKVLSPSTIEYSESCKFLQGHYKYNYQPLGSSIRHQLFVEFLVTQTNSKSHSFLINSPIVLEIGTQTTD